MWDKIFSTEILDTPTSYPLTFLLPERFWNTAQKGYSTKCFGNVRKKIFDGKSWHNRLKQKIVRYPKINDTLEGSPTKFLGTVRQKTFEGKNLDTSPSLLSKLFRYQSLSEAQHRRVTLRQVSVLWDKKFLLEKFDTPPHVLIHKLNRYRKHSETQHKRVWRKIFWCCETKNSTKKRDITVLSMNLFHTRIQWHGKGFPYEIFPHSGKKISKENFDTSPSLLSKNFSRYQTFSETQHIIVTLRNDLVLWGKNFSTENRDKTLKSMNFLDGRK